MIVYMQTAEAQARHTLMVTPGKTSDCSEFHENGKPKLMPIVFRYGRAEVPGNLGDWLVDHGYARKSRLIIPEGVRL